MAIHQKFLLSPQMSRVINNNNNKIPLQKYFYFIYGDHLLEGRWIKLYKPIFKKQKKKKKSKGFFKLLMLVSSEVRLMASVMRTHLQQLCNQKM